MSQCLIVSKTKFLHSVTTTFFFARFSVKALSLCPLCGNLMKLRIFGFFFFNAKDERRTTNQPEISCSSWKNSSWSTKVASVLQEVYGDDTMSRTRLFEWHRRFEEGREEVKDDHRSGRPSTSRTDENFERVRQKVRSDRRLTVKMIADELRINSERVWRIITENPGMRRICAKMVPRLVNEGQKERRVQVCQDILEQLETEPKLLKRVVTGDKSWIFEYDPLTKWKSALSPRPKKARVFKTKTKVMLIAFFDVQGIVHAEFLPQGQTINQHVYKNILRRLMRSVREKRRELWETKPWLLHHDNVPAHNALGIREFLAKITLLYWSNHPTLQIWPLVASLCFPKRVIKETCFQDSRNYQSGPSRKLSKKLVFKIQKPLKPAVTRELRAIPDKSFQECVEPWRRGFGKVHSSARRLL